mmetsp:Transcript_3067/g.6376  ORF Transcript_3067/g.6376 Transcript_3067/m.6376 type:complete len:786 (+) Transcript_3067:1646-4003(+)
MSHEAYPLRSPNPHTMEFRPEDYVSRFPGWLNMYKNPDSIFPSNIPVIQMSHSDFSVLEIDYDVEVAQGKHEKKYDFIYAMTNTEAEVKNGCTGWGAYAKNWPLAKKAMDIMCLEMNFTGVVLGIVDSNGNSCEIPPSCQNKVVTAPFVNYFEGLNFMRQSKFLFLPQVYDASPRVAVEAMSLNVPLLMNNQIVGGWKYINDETGEFFNDNMSDFRSSLVKLVNRLDSYSPRSYVELNYGTKIAGSKLRAFVEKNFSDRVSLHKESHLLIPSEPPSNDKINTDDTVESAHDHDERLLLIDTDGQEDCGLESQIPDCEGLSFGSGKEGGSSVDVSIPLEHETLKEMPPSSLDLDCSRFGGPSDQSMQYWNSANPHDLSYKSHFWSDSGNAKYLTFDPGYEGWNNARLYFENVLVLAHATGRTLVLPPRNKLNHLNGSHAFEDFFNIGAINSHLEGINIISMEEFLRKEALSGNLNDAGCTSNDCALLPPESRINWNGHKLEEIYTYLEKIGTVPQWNTYPPKCAVLIPATDSYVNANKNHLHKNDSNLPICNYNSTESVLHLSKRILAPFYSFVLFEEESQDLFAKRFVRDFLHYNDEVLCGSARIVGAIEEYAVSMGFPTEFTSMHIRRGDFSIQYPEGALSAEDLLLQFEADGLSEKKLVYIATDEKDKDFFQPFKDKHHVVFLDDFAAHFESIDSAYYGLLDQLVASKGKVFYGTWPSTFSSYINRLRGYFSIKDGIDTGGTINSFYFSKEHKNIMMEYKAVDHPSVSWMREYPDAWYLIDQE